MSEDRTRQETEEEKKAWAMRFFDYAETPIKEWVSSYLEEDMETVFPDYTADSDIISIQEDNGTHYNVYLTPFPTTIKDGTAFIVEKNIFNTSEKLKKAASLLFDAVYAVYVPVIKSMVNMRHRMEDIFPKFNDKQMYFEFNMVNKYYMLKQQAGQHLIKIDEQFDRIKDIHTQDANEIRTKLATLNMEYSEKHNAITKEILDTQEGLCIKENAIFALGTKLYIVLETNIKPKDDIIMKHLPDFGLKYQDPDEDNYVDRYKKEMGIDE
jgi:hypothetical protein